MTAEVRRENVRQAAPAPAADANEHQYHEIAGAGHCANLDRPDETNAVVVDFLARHLGGQSPGSGPAG